MPMHIPLTRGAATLVDDADYPQLAAFRWHCTAKGYAARVVVHPGGKKQTIYMHRQLLDAPPELQVDHINVDNKNVIVGSIAEVMHDEGEIFQAWVTEFVTKKSTPIRNAGQRVQVRTVLDWIKNNYPTYLAHKAQQLKPKAEPEYEEYKAGYSF